MKTLPVGQRKGEYGNTSTWLRAVLPCSISFPSLYVGTRGVSVFYHYCILGKKILWKLNRFVKKLLWLGASNDNIRESRITVKDKTKTCQNRKLISCMLVAVPTCMMTMKCTPKVIIFTGKAMYLYCMHHCAKYLNV